MKYSGNRLLAAKSTRDRWQLPQLNVKAETHKAKIEQVEYIKQKTRI